MLSRTYCVGENTQRQKRKERFRWDRMLGEITQRPMSTKKSRVRRHSISSLEEAAKKVAQEPVTEATMPSTQNASSGSFEQTSDRRYNARKRPLPIDASIANDISPAKKFALLAGGLTMEDLVKNAPATAGGDQYLCLPGGERHVNTLSHVGCHVVALRHTGLHASFSSTIVKLRKWWSLLRYTRVTTRSTSCSRTYYYC